MVSKDNRYRQQLTTARDGLRKLGMGVVSALLGTTLYWAGAGNNIVKADTTTVGNDTGSNQVTSGSGLTGNQAVVLHQNGTEQEAPARSAVSAVATVRPANSVTPLIKTSSAAALTASSGQPLATQAVAAEKDVSRADSPVSAAEGDQPVRDTAINSAAVIKPVTSDRQVTSPAGHG